MAIFNGRCSSRGGRRTRRMMPRRGGIVNRDECRSAGRRSEHDRQKTFGRCGVVSLATIDHESLSRPPMSMFHPKSIGLFALAVVLLGSGAAAFHPAAGEKYQLRAYRGIRHRVEQHGERDAAVTIHYFFLDDARHAGWFASKIYSDFALTSGNRVT